MAVNDLILLSDVGEKQVVKELSTRYQANDIYTYIGPVLIAINPYKSIKKDGKSIYDESLYDNYCGREIHENNPHPFAIAESAYSNLIHFKMNQCLLITGESGSGKTETSKYVLQYIANISTRPRTRQAMNASRQMSDDKKYAMDERVNHVRHILIGANPVLESFGNARTIQNNNSSRFGKYMLLQMNSSAQVIGGFVHNYLLERNRVIFQAPGERNYHCFYQLLNGATKNELEKWHLQDPSKYAILQHEYRKIEGVDDKTSFHELIEHLTVVGITQDMQQDIFQQIAAILHLGNIKFISKVDSNHNPSCSIETTTQESLLHAAELIGIRSKTLEELFTFKSLVINDTEMQVPLTSNQGEQVLHSLICCLYDKLFTWLVSKINKNIYQINNVSYTIGILDIYGFEIFEKNKFEQLCINYVNEKLQQLFIAQTLQSEQLEYEREGIQWKNIEYFNNQVVCDLIENIQLPGIFPLLDEQCIISQTSIDVLIHRFNETFESHEYYIKSRVKGSIFSIRHYAGIVEYDLKYFAEANYDSFYTELYRELNKSTNLFLQNFVRDERTTNQKLKRPPSTSFQFRSQVNDLVQELNQCNPHYVRCIKPNERKAAGTMNPQLVTNQVRCLGLVENVRVRRAGFCYRETYAVFFHRYKLLSSSSWLSTKHCSWRQATVELLTADDVGVLPKNQSQHKTVYKAHIAAKNGKTTADIDTTILPFKEDSDTLGCFSLGRNKIFIKHPAALFSLERLRQDKLPQIAKIIEDAWRRRLLRFRIIKYIDLYNQVHDSYVAVLTNIQLRLRRSGDAAQVKDQLYQSWNTLANQVLPTTTRFHRRLQYEEEFNKVSFATSFIKRNAAVRHLRNLKNSVQIISSRWRGRQVCAKMPPAQWNQCYQAMLGIRTEFEQSFGKKKLRRDTLDRRYLHDYLDLSKHPQLRAFMKKSNESQLLYAGRTIKVNERFVAQPRLLLVGETYLHNIKAHKIEKPKERRLISICDLEKLSMSSLHDNYLFVHVRNQVGLMYEVNEKTEIVLALLKRYKELCRKVLPVEIQDTIEFQAKRGRFLSFRFLKDLTTTVTTMTKIDKKQGEITVGMKYS